MVARLEKSMKKKFAKRKRGAASTVSIEVDGREIELPRSAFEEGAYEISLIGETHVEIDDYVASVRAFFWALKERGLTSIQF